MTDWPPPDPNPTWPPPQAPSQPQPQPQPGQPFGYPPAWGTPYPTAPPPAGQKLPWYRSTAFLILGGLGLLGVGAAVGATVTFVATNAAEGVADAFDEVTTEVTTYGVGGDLATFSLGAGQCATEDVYEANGYPEGSAVPCEVRHAVEHYASVEPPNLDADGSGFDRADLDDFGDSACYLAFTPYVGLAYEDSDYDYATVVPSEAAWSGGTRTIHCLLFAFEGGSTTGSAHDTRR